MSPRLSAGHSEQLWGRLQARADPAGLELGPWRTERRKEPKCRPGLGDAGWEFDICFTSVQKRAMRTLWAVLDALDHNRLPVVRAWPLNERPCGGLAGLNKAETAAKPGEAQAKCRRRPYDIPPLMEPDLPYSHISKGRRYADLGEDQPPSWESLKDTLARALPFWNREIVPLIKEGTWY